ncbi:MAG: hypothetical protein JNL50_10635 [Phycisphaerae bacterium]|nr:hypothetical protein [Phycisphaerae bacterium]
MLCGRLKIGSVGRADLRGIVHLGMAVLFLLLLGGCSRTHTLRLDGDGTCRSGTAVVRVEHMALRNSATPRVMMTIRNVGSEPLRFDSGYVGGLPFWITDTNGRDLFEWDGILYCPDERTVLIDPSPDVTIQPGEAIEFTDSNGRVRLPDGRFRRGARLKLDHDLRVWVGTADQWRTLPFHLTGQLE